MEMDELISADIGRMLQTIENDISVRLQEINMETESMYSEMKRRYEEEFDLYEKREREKISKLFEVKRKKEMSKLCRERELIMQKIKSRKIRRIIGKVKERISEVPLSEGLIENCFREAEKYEEMKIEEMDVYCAKGDESVVKKFVSGPFYEIPSERLGGIIAVSRKNKNIYDNTYLTRLNILLEKHFDLFYKLFSFVEDSN